MYWLRNLAIKRMRLLFANGADEDLIERASGIMDGHDPDVGPYARMSREDVASRLDQAYDDGDAWAFLNLEEYLMDKLTLEELKVYNLGLAVSASIGEGLDALPLARMEVVMPKVYNLLIELNEELNPQPMKGA